ncbi:MULTISPECIES: hypothetical protein [unclassified Mycoplasma]|uniref:hypothetical protein n=1 Tax=unclassified Mycoplasma TaxID=2683645 RepID=UPI00211CF822|nr:MULTISPECIES: hypothetical protein [unclassified Mycoplasma]UUM19601.1 hypothetical protein NPA11_02385 [Mycoplasma sp. 1578d]UUM24521.1 hypothetical protein NPA12_02365 [Mycoplasma sp. 3686d]
MENKTFNIFKINKEHTKKIKFLLTLFEIDNRIFFIELVDDLSKLADKNYEDAIPIYTKDKQNDFYCNLEAIYMCSIKEFEQFADNVTTQFINGRIDDFFRLRVLNLINENITQNNERINLIYLNDNTNNQNSNITN